MDRYYAFIEMDYHTINNRISASVYYQTVFGCWTTEEGSILFYLSEMKTLEDSKTQTLSPRYVAG